MLDRLLDFVQLCRKNGLRLSTAESLDATRAALVVGVESPEQLREALRATLVKRRADDEAFDELFDLCFYRPGEFFARAAAEAAPLVEALRREGVSDDEIERLLAMLSDEAAHLEPLARTALGLRRTHVEALLRLLGVRLDLDRLLSPMQIGFFTQQALEALGGHAAAQELAGLRARLERTLGAARAELIARLAQENLRRLKAQVRTFVTDEFARRHQSYAADMKRLLLSEKPFSAMNEAELASLRAEVTRLGRKLRQQASRRRRTLRRGRLDARRTLRRALVSGGVPFQLRFRRRRIERPRLVVLCDISDSVRQVSRFMLQLAYTLQELFSKVRSFVFVSELGECTQLFKEHPIERAVELAYSGGVVNVYANSNFGRALTLFHQRYLDSVTGKTTVLVIGDGRNNYNPTESWALAAVHARAKRVLWLNPEPPLSWAFGDSVMREYEPHCTQVETVNNLASLARVIDKLVL